MFQGETFPNRKVFVTARLGQQAPFWLKGFEWKVDCNECKQACFYWALEEAKEYVPEPLLYYFITKSYCNICFFPKYTW